MSISREDRWTVSYVLDERGVSIARRWTALDSVYSVTRSDDNRFEVRKNYHLDDNAPALADFGGAWLALDFIEELEAEDIELGIDRAIEAGEFVVFNPELGPDQLDSLTEGAGDYDCTDPENPAWGDCAWGIEDDELDNAVAAAYTLSSEALAEAATEAQALSAPEVAPVILVRSGSYPGTDLPTFDVFDADEYENASIRRPLKLGEVWAVGVPGVVPGRYIPTGVRWSRVGSWDSSPVLPVGAYAEAARQLANS